MASATGTAKATGVAVHWFRRGLRVHDNPGLAEAARAAAAGGGGLLPLFVLDPWFIEPSRIGAARLRFVLDSLADLDQSLRALGSRLVVALGRPEEVFEALCTARPASVAVITHEKEIEPYGVERDARVAAVAARHGVPVSMHASHNLWDLDALLARCGNKPPLTMTSFRKLVASAGPPAAPVPAPDRLPPLPEGLLHHSSTDQQEGEGEEGQGASPLLRWHGIELHGSVPSLADFAGRGYRAEDAAHLAFAGGETAALQQLDAWLANGSKVARFEKPNTNPTALAAGRETTGLSPHLKTGTLSIRLFHQRLMAVYAKHKGHTQPPVSLEGQLLWREFYHLVAAGTPNFGQMQGNPICKQIPWDGDAEARARVARWEQGQTGFPAVDAAMNQLRREGWMHHLARHLVACFLTRGDLWVHWELGRDVFDRHLIDGDWALNSGNWMWLSASCFFHAYYRVYSPVAFFKKKDPDGAYIRKHVPALARMPARHIYEPWKAPLAVQRKAGCVIGTDYPAPMVNHDAAKTENLAKMKRAYAAGKQKAPASSSSSSGGGPKKKKARKG